VKILVLGSRIPWPLHDGGAIATYQLLKGLSEDGAEVVYFSFNTRKHFISKEQIKTHFSFCRVVDVPLDANPSVLGAIWALLTGRNYNISRFEDKAAKQALATLLQHEKFDWVQIEGLYAAPFLSEIIKAGLPVSLRQHNAEFQIWERLSASSPVWLKRWYFKLLAAQLKRYEIRVLSEVDAIIPITAADEELFASLSPDKPMYLLPVGQEITATPGSGFIQNSFFHLGSMEWMPNVEGVKWLTEQVWPLVKSKFPDAELHLAGKGLSTTDSRFNGIGIVLHGEIENATDFMQTSGTMLVPVFAAGGIRVKILEAFNARVPVISTAVGIQGIPASHEKELLIANSASEFADAMIRMQTDVELREKLVKNAHALIDEHYNTKRLISGLLDFYVSFQLTT
jgi:glycosyltransferase involved in cell wall biosynthesis